MVILRQAEARDLGAFYGISLATGHLGGDAGHLHDDPKLIGHIYSAPYLTHAPELCFVAEDEEGVAGYVVGALDTGAFADLLEREWWPALRGKYPAPSEATRRNWTPDDRRIAMLHSPDRTPSAVVEAFPAHLHMNLLPRRQGQGLGSRLLERWLAAAQDKGAKGAHVGSNAKNPRAFAFWRKCGFVPIDRLPPSRTTWLGRGLVHGLCATRQANL